MSDSQQPKVAATRRKNRFRFFGNQNASRRRGRPGGVRRWLERLPDRMVDRKMNAYQFVALILVGLLIYFVIMPLIGDWNPSAATGD